MDQSEIDLSGSLATLRRRLWLLVFLPVLAALTAGLISKYMLEPVYSASATILVTSEGDGQMSYNDVLLSRNLTKTYAQVAKSRTVVGAAIKRMGITDMTVQELQSRLTVTSQGETEVLSFTVRHVDPHMAAKLADGMAETFKETIGNYMNVQNVAVLDKALVPSSPVEPRTRLNVAGATMLGLVMAIGLAFGLESLDTSIKNSEDVTRILDLPVLGTIPLIDSKAVDRALRRRAFRSTSTRSGITLPGEGEGK